MQRTQIIRCPNCGSLATRQFLNDERSIHVQHLGGKIIRTECPVCDYLMIMRSLDGSVLEAYTPGIFPTRNQRFVFNSSLDVSPKECRELIL